jgi:hypothetical protein
VPCTVSRPDRMGSPAVRPRILGSAACCGERPTCYCFAASAARRAPFAQARHPVVYLPRPVGDLPALLPHPASGSRPTGSDHTPCVLRQRRAADRPGVAAALARRPRAACEVRGRPAPRRARPPPARDCLPRGPIEMIPHGLLRRCRRRRAAPRPGSAARRHFRRPRRREGRRADRAVAAAVRTTSRAIKARSTTCSAARQVDCAGNGTAPRLPTCTSRCSRRSARRPTASSSTKRSRTAFPRWYRTMAPSPNAAAPPASW